MNIYIAGPMRGHEDFNFPAFFEMEELLIKMNHDPFNPARRDVSIHGASAFKSPAGSPADLPTSFNLRGALCADTGYITRTAEAIVALDGWERSTGALAEVALARSLGLPVYTVSKNAPHRLLVVEEDHTGPLVGVQVEEVRSVSATGGEKGTKLARYDLVPARPLKELAEHYGRGAAKYADRNWELGYEWSKNFAALNRHLWQFWAGEDIDPETGSSHLTAVAWHAFALREFAETHPEFDDRPGTKLDE